MLIALIAAFCLALWIVLIAGRGLFWMCLIRDGGNPSPPKTWPSVMIVIPARNEAECLGAALASHLAQDYPGPLSVVVVDDDSADGTGDIARATGASAPPGRSVTVIRGHGPPPGWTGKLYALKQGIDAAEIADPRFILLTDADIVHAPDTLSWLVAHALSGGYALTSLMARLRCESLAERSHVPAFIFFFQMLYPFRWVARRKSRTAGGAGGCMLVEAKALRAIGGIETLRNALIDDCTLARKLKEQGPIWLGLTDRVVSLRPYPHFEDVRAMVARSAYAQLGFSPPKLLGTVAGMALVYLAPPLLTLFAHGAARWMGLAAWIAMALAFQPTLAFYRRSPLWGPALSLIALLYTFYTLDSAWRHMRRRGGEWKGRVHAGAPSL